MRRRMAIVGDVIRYKTLGGIFSGKVVEKHSDYIMLELNSPREPYYHELMTGYTKQDLMKDHINRRGDYEILKYAGEDND